MPLLADKDAETEAGTTTSARLGSTAIPETLDLLENRFDPAMLEEIKKRKSGEEFVPRGDAETIDVPLRPRSARVLVA